MKSFGQTAKDFRIEKGFTLRNFCSKANLDPSNWSKVERELMEPPKDKEIIETIASALNLDNEQKQKLMDLAIIHSIPKELVDEQIVKKLPIFFRTLSGKKPTEKELKELIKLLSKP
jgi:transcriptional regulator with XRE-family HTH domain